jgi:disulfide oxidoreductase YuzD
MQVRPKMYHPSTSWTDQDLVNVSKINFFGGEPLLDKEHPKILERLVASGLSQQITLFYSTNCQQVASRRLLDLWKHFKRIEVFFSVDGTKDQFEYLRWPGKWSRTQRVIEWFLALPKTFPNVDWYFRGSQCVSLFNVASYWHTAEWLKNMLGGVYFNIVDHPNYLRMTALPEESKHKIASHIPDEHIKQYLFIEQSNPDFLRQFVIWCKRQDLYRSQDFTKTFPETHALISQEWEKYNASDI